MKAHLITVGVLVVLGLFIWANVVWNLWPVVIVAAIGFFIGFYVITHDVVKMELENRKRQREQSARWEAGK